ncbi:hypothetical protein GQX74_013707 [Glossina fuscipes]|nr:hypothetical protein GQX74_013707 [Glossina fuscipes]
MPTLSDNPKSNFNILPVFCWWVEILPIIPFVGGLKPTTPFCRYWVEICLIFETTDRRRTLHFFTDDIAQFVVDLSHIFQLVPLKLSVAHFRLFPFLLVSLVLRKISCLCHQAYDFIKILFEDKNWGPQTQPVVAFLRRRGGHVFIKTEHFIFDISMGTRVKRNYSDDKTRSSLMGNSSFIYFIIS